MTGLACAGGLLWCDEGCGDGLNYGLDGPRGNNVVVDDPALEAVSEVRIRSELGNGIVGGTWLNVVGVAWMADREPMLAIALSFCVSELVAVSTLGPITGLFARVGELCVGTLARGNRHECGFSLGCSAGDGSRQPLKASLLLEEDSSHRVEGEINDGLEA